MDKEELYKTILINPTYKYPLLNEIYAIRDKQLETEDYTIAVNGFISVDNLLDNYNLANEKQQLLSFLEDKLKRIINQQKKETGLDWTYDEGQIDMIKKVLDFVNKGEN